jgi:hypothetical protein
VAKAQEDLHRAGAIPFPHGAEGCRPLGFVVCRSCCCAPCSSGCQNWQGTLVRLNRARDSPENLVGLDGAVNTRAVSPEFTDLCHSVRLCATISG